MGRVALVAERRAVPEGIHLRRAGGRRRMADLLPKSLQQGHGERIGLGTEPGHIALGHLQPAGQLGSPGDQRSRASGHEGDSADRPQRGAGRVTSRSAGVQRKVYQSGQPPRGLQTSTPMIVAAKAMPTPAHNAPASVSLGAVAPKESGGGDDERRDRDQEGELPGEPESYGHAPGRRRDTPAQAADQVGSREQQSHTDEHPVPAAGKPPSPEPHSRHSQQNSSETEHAGGTGERAEQWCGRTWPERRAAAAPARSRPERGQPATAASAAGGNAPPADRKAERHGSDQEYQPDNPRLP